MPYIVKIMPKSHPPANRLVVGLAYDGLCTFEFGVAVELFGLARPEMGPDWYSFAVAGIDAGPMKAQGGIRVLADGGMELLRRAGTIVVPGWRGAEATVPEPVIAALREAHARGARVLSICSGVFVLAAAGLLSGRRATTHWRYTGVLKEMYPDIKVEPDVLYVDEGNVLTSAGSAAGIDLCLHLVRRDFGTDAANKVARRLVVPPHRDGGQVQFIEQPVPVPFESARIGPLLDAMRSDLARDWQLAHLAKRAGMSMRTFLRRFEDAVGTTPAKWLVRERLAAARDLLERSDLSIDEVAELSGFGAAATMRHHFRRLLSTTPVAYRAAFSAV